jgi:hypothetical protein
VTRGFAVVQVLGVIALAIMTAWIATTKSMHFPVALRNEHWVCDMGQGQVWYPTTMDADTDAWYSSALRAAREPSLYLASLDAEATPVEVVRFTWLRSFHDPVVVRVDQTADGVMRLTATQMYVGLPRQGRAYRRVAKVLSVEESAVFHKLLATGGLAEALPVSCEGGTDGAEWIIERSGPGHYAYWNRRSPDGGPVREVGLMMLKLTGWSVEPVY